MATFKIEVTETLTRTITLEAISDEAALQQVRALYTNEDIVLDSGDFVGVEFGVGNEIFSKVLNSIIIPSAAFPPPINDQ